MELKALIFDVDGILSESVLDRFEVIGAADVVKRKKTGRRHLLICSR